LWRIMKEVIAFCTVFDSDLINYLLILWERLIKPTKNMIVTACGR